MAGSLGGVVDLADIHNELESLADRAAFELEHWQTVTDPPTEDARTAVAALEARLVEAGIAPKHAEWAITRWIITRRPVVECVEQTGEDGLLGD